MKNVQCEVLFFFQANYDDKKQKKRRKSSLKMGNEQLLMIQSITNTVNLALID